MKAIQLAQVIKRQLLILALLLLSSSSFATTEVVTYYVNDALGSPILAMDDQGAVVWQEGYQPYGQRQVKSVAANSDEQFYTGKQEEPDIGLQYFGARWYDPEAGRFTSIDPVGVQEGQIHSFNRYNYANNNPYRYIDPDGREVRAVFNLKLGILTVTDIDNKESVSIKAFSGGKPLGDPIPLGSYDILDHPKNNFFRLEPIDSIYGNDKEEVSGRDEFRLHKPGNSLGCVTAKDVNEWVKARDLIRKTQTTEVEVDSKSRNPFSPDKEPITKFGTLEVVL